MTISELTLKSNDLEPVRRFEVFTGSGRRREWPPEEKARIVAESYKAGETVSAVARRYALSPQQLFALAPSYASALVGGDGIRIPVRSCGGRSVLAGTGGAAPSTTTEAEDGPRRRRDRA
ncbi:transposase [Mesorhizobium sp. M0408]|uniref:transposase n=1 Tax=Mesorhizobium sp. M0408 TaxID=2956942 RepID=UPI00333D6700